MEFLLIPILTKEERSDDKFLYKIEKKIDEMNIRLVMILSDFQDDPLDFALILGKGKYREKVDKLRIVCSRGYGSSDDIISLRDKWGSPIGIFCFSKNSYYNSGNFKIRMIVDKDGDMSVDPNTSLIVSTIRTKGVFCGIDQKEGYSPNSDIHTICGYSSIHGSKDKLHTLGAFPDLYHVKLTNISGILSGSENKISVSISSLNIFAEIQPTEEEIKKEVMKEI